jgi:hypothetical protein
MGSHWSMAPSDGGIFFRIIRIHGDLHIVQDGIHASFISFSHFTRSITIHLQPCRIYILNSCCALDCSVIENILPHIEAIPISAYASTALRHTDT